MNSRKNVLSQKQNARHTTGRQPGAPHGPCVAQPKMAAAPHLKKQPVAPPVYRPQPAPKAVQPKLANAAQNRAPRIAPPVYRPEAKKFVQPKMAAATQAPGPTKAPPVYRPRPVPKVLQGRRGEPGKTATKPFNVQPLASKTTPRPFTAQPPAPFGRLARAAAPADAPHASAIRKPPAVQRVAQKTFGSRGAGGMVQLKPTPSGVSGAHAQRRFTQPSANNFQTRSSVIQTFKFKFEIAGNTRTINTETYAIGSNPTEEPGMITWLEYVLSQDDPFHPDTSEDLTGTDKKEIRTFISNLRGNLPTNRQMFGYQNPTHNSTLGLDLLEEGAHTPYDSNRWADKEDWLMSPSRNFVTYSPNSRTQDPVMTQSHTNVVLGHDEGASVHFNRVGHTQTPQQNQKYNKTKKAYHGLEQRNKSNKSGGSSARYVKPDQTMGSHPMYWDPNHKDYDPNYQK